VLRHHFNWNRFSMLAALAYRADGTEAALVFQIKDGTYNTESLIEFLEEFHTHFEGEKVTLIWDGLSAHKSKAMLDWIAEQRSWLVVERLPGYAPELNPVELVWGNAKSSELANLCPDSIDDAEVVADAALARIGNNEQMCFNFLEHTGLSL
jgi:transposase